MLLATVAGMNDAVFDSVSIDSSVIAIAINDVVEERIVSSMIIFFRVTKCLQN